VESVEYTDGYNRGYEMAYRSGSLTGACAFDWLVDALRDDLREYPSPLLKIQRLMQWHFNLRERDDYVGNYFLNRARCRMEFRRMPEFRGRQFQWGYTRGYVEGHNRGFDDGFDQKFRRTVCNLCTIAEQTL
jgi:hypothetical protein